MYFTGERMRIYHHIDEFLNALADWKRYRFISEDLFVSDRDTRNMVLHAMMISIQSSIDIAADIIADGKLEKPGSYREACQLPTNEFAGLRLCTNSGHSSGWLTSHPCNSRVYL